MRSARTNFLTIAFVLSSATAFPYLRAAESAPAAAPEKIEFSRSSSTTPKIPRPGLKNEDRLKNFGNVPVTGPQMDIPPAIAPNTSTVLPSKAAAKKLLEEWDRKKNWAVPTKEEKDSDDPLAKVDEPSEDDLTGPDKPKSVMDEFMNGGDSKKKNFSQSRSRDLDRDGERRDNRLTDPRDRDRDRNDRTDDNDSTDDRDRERDANDNSESNGLAAFNLKKFIREQNGMSAFKDQQLPRAAQLFRSEIGNNGMDQRQIEKDRAAREVRSAEFMQMIKPRTSGTLAGTGDPINAPDLTRNAANPITPRGLPSSSELSRSPFSGPSQSPASRIQDNAMLGVTGPGPSMGPSVSAPAARPVDATRSRQIIIEAPRRIGF